MKGIRRVGVCVGVLIGMLGVQGARAQWNPPNPVVRFEKKGNALEVRQKASEALLRPPSPFASCDSGHCVARSVVMNRKGRTGLGG